MANVKYPQPEGLVIDASRKQKWQSDHGYLGTDSRFCDTEAFKARYLADRPASLLQWIQDLSKEGFAVPIYPTCNAWRRKALESVGEGEATTQQAKPQAKAVEPVSPLYAMFEEEYEAKKGEAYTLWITENQSTLKQRMIDKAAADADAALAAELARFAPVVEPTPEPETPEDAQGNV